MVNIKCAIYCRVSKEEQNPEHQVKALKKYAKDQGYKIFKVYTDMISGTKSSRPELNELMFDMRMKKFDVVLVWRLDRMGRSLKHLINIIEEFEKKNVDFISMNEGFDTSTPHGKLFFQIAGAFAEFERNVISERTKLALKHNKRVGKRGKDKKQRSNVGYKKRYQKNGGPTFV